MAKTYGKKQYVGKISKRKDGSGSYLKINKKITLEEGQYLTLESVADQIKSWGEAVEAGRVTEEFAMEKIEKLEDSKKNYGLLFDVTFTPVTEG